MQIKNLKNFNMIQNMCRIMLTENSYNLLLLCSFILHFTKYFYAVDFDKQKNCKNLQNFVDTSIASDNFHADASSWQLNFKMQCVQIVVNRVNNQSHTIRTNLITTEVKLEEGRVVVN